MKVKPLGLTLILNVKPLDLPLILKVKEGLILVIAEAGMAGRRQSPPFRDINLRFLSILSQQDMG